jgi:hypothetical protein
MRSMSDTSITSSANERLRNSRPLNSKCHYGILSIFESTLRKLIQCFHNVHISYVCINEILFHVAHLLDYLGRGLDYLPIGVRFQLGANSFPFFHHMHTGCNEHAAFQRCTCPWSLVTAATKLWPVTVDISNIHFADFCPLHREVCKFTSTYQKPPRNSAVQR